MATHFQIIGIVTLVVGVQLITSEIAVATNPLGTFSHSRFHATAATNLTLAFAENSQMLPDKSLSAKYNGGYTPPDAGGPGSSLGAGTR